MNLAPIVLFVYNRPWHTEQTLNALKKAALANESELYIFSDGAKTIEDEEKVINVRSIIKKELWCKQVHFIESDRNQGLEVAIQNGLNTILNNYEKVIVLEDDILVSPQFLHFMNINLEHYKTNESVYHVSANSIPITLKSKETMYFLHSATCWGWGTWKRAWKRDLIQLDSKKLLNELKSKKLIKRFSFNYTSSYIRILENNAEGKNHSWAIKWYAYMVLHNKLSLHPTQTLTYNCGQDGSGTNKSDVIDKIISFDAFKVQKNDLFADKVQISSQAYKQYVSFYRQYYKINFFKYIKGILTYGFF